MLEALIRLPSPQSLPQLASKTGTSEAPLVMLRFHQREDHQLDHGSAAEGQRLALIGTPMEPSAISCQEGRTCYNPPDDIELHASATNGADEVRQVLINKELRPSTQVD
jgi:hypothetical protein